MPRFSNFSFGFFQTNLLGKNERIKWSLHRVCVRKFHPASSVEPSFLLEAIRQPQRDKLDAFIIPRESYYFSSSRGRKKQTPSFDPLFSGKPSSLESCLKISYPMLRTHVNEIASCLEQLLQPLNVSRLFGNLCEREGLSDDSGSYMKQRTLFLADKRESPSSAEILSKIDESDSFKEKKSVQQAFLRQEFVAEKRRAQKVVALLITSPYTSLAAQLACWSLSEVSFVCLRASDYEVLEDVLRKKEEETSLKKGLQEEEEDLFEERLKIQLAETNADILIVSPQFRSLVEPVCTALSIPPAYLYDNLNLVTSQTHSRNLASVYGEAQYLINLNCLERKLRDPNFSSKKTDEDEVSFVDYTMLKGPDEIFAALESFQAHRVNEESQHQQNPSDPIISSAPSAETSSSSSNPNSPYSSQEKANLQEDSSNFAAAFFSEYSQKSYNRKFLHLALFTHQAVKNQLLKLQDSLKFEKDDLLLSLVDSSQPKGCIDTSMFALFCGCALLNFSAYATSLTSVLEELDAVYTTNDEGSSSLKPVTILAMNLSQLNKNMEEASSVTAFSTEKRNRWMKHVHTVILFEDDEAALSDKAKWNAAQTLIYRLIGNRAVRLHCLVSLTEMGSVLISSSYTAPAASSPLIFYPLSGIEILIDTATQRLLLKDSKASFNAYRNRLLSTSNAFTEDGYFLTPYLANYEEGVDESLQKNENKKAGNSLQGIEIIGTVSDETEEVKQFISKLRKVSEVKDLMDKNIQGYVPYVPIQGTRWGNFHEYQSYWKKPY